MRMLVLVLAFAIAAPSMAVAEPPHTHEIIYTRPSGFWTSNLPAQGGAYRWRLLGVGGGVALLMGAIVLALLRKPRNSSDRSARRASSRPS